MGLVAPCHSGDVYEGTLVTPGLACSLVKQEVSQILHQATASG